MSTARPQQPISRNHACLLVLVAGLAVDLAHAADAPPPAIDPAAMEALKTMGVHLRDLKAFTTHADTTVDEVSGDGQKIQYGGTVDLRVRRPDHLRADVNSDRRQRSYYYAGKTVTLYAPRMGYYATVDAPPTIGELIDVLDEKFDISLPLIDLFLWGTKDADGSAITAASYVGPAAIAGRECDHYAYRQPDADWQVWIGSDNHLPCKLVITTMDQASQPQYTANFTWRPSATLDDKDFVFVAPKDAHKIELQIVNPSAD